MSSHVVTVPETEGGTMSFLDHLDELRRRLTHAVIAIAIAFVVAFAISDKIYAFLDKPVREALREVTTVQIKSDPLALQPLEKLTDNSTFTYVFNSETTLQGVTIPTGTTIAAKLERQPNNTRAVVSTARVVVGNVMIPEGFKLSLAEIGEYHQGQNEAVVVHTLQGGFNLYIKVAFYAALAFSMPFLLYQLWLFIAPGLYDHEKRGVFPFVLLATLCFVCGTAFAYYIAFPRAARFLLGVSQNFRPMIEVNEYFDLIITIILGLGVVFEIPAIVYFFAKLGLVTPGFMIRFWRHAMVVILIIAAVLSPTTDIPNMMVFALPMVGLYFLSVGIAWLVGKPRVEREA